MSTAERRTDHVASVVLPRIIDVDPDFRRNPKTDRYCFYCQRDLKPGVGYTIFVVDLCLQVVHPEDKNMIESFECLIGPECAKRIPQEYVVWLQSAK